MVTTVRHSAEEAYKKFKNVHVKKRSEQAPPQK
jgi:hypothetical protein